MDRATATFVDGMGAAAATSGILSQVLFTAIDAGIGAFTQGKPLDPEALRNVLIPPRSRQRG